MKLNAFVPTRNGGKFADNQLNHSSITGEAVNGPYSPEDEVITEIDESRMSPEKFIATRFLTFLGNRGLTLKSLNSMPIEEQKRVIKEFIEG